MRDINEIVNDLQAGLLMQKVVLDELRNDLLELIEVLSLGTSASEADLRESNEIDRSHDG